MRRRASVVVRKGGASEDIKFATDNTKPKRGSVVVSGVSFRPCRKRETYTVKRMLQFN